MTPEASLGQQKTLLYRYFDLKVACQSFSKRTFGLNSQAQKSILENHRQKKPPAQLHEVGFKVHSQYEEDGILLYIFSLIGTTNKQCVEICCGDAVECNTTNLIVNHGWQGLLFDGNENLIYKARKFFSLHPRTQKNPPKVFREWITKNNINTLLEKNEFRGDVDLLSLDVDGVDYWLFKEINCISPRVVVLEINHLWGPEKAVTVPYKDDFKAVFSKWGADYAGASLKAFMDLGQEKGYRFIGTNAIATNAFFLRKDNDCPQLPDAIAENCFSHPRAQFGMKERLPKVKDMSWVEL